MDKELDLNVAKALKLNYKIFKPGEQVNGFTIQEGHGDCLFVRNEQDHWQPFCPSNAYGNGMEIIEKHGIDFEWVSDASVMAKSPHTANFAYGDNYLIAGLRLVVMDELE